MKGCLARLLRQLGSEAGQTVVEYGLILTFIALVVIVVLGFLGGQVVTVFSSAASGL